MYLKIGRKAVEIDSQYIRFFGWEMFIERTQRIQKQLFDYIKDEQGGFDALLFGRWHLTANRTA